MYKFIEFNESKTDNIDYLYGMAKLGFIKK